MSIKIIMLSTTSEKVDTSKKRTVITLLKPPLLRVDKKDVVILDETFTNIDTNTTQAILPHTLDATKDKIVIIILHDESIKAIMAQHGAHIMSV